MPITFTQAITVAEGEKLTSRQMRSLARAFNDRLRSGIGDGAWRIHYLFLSLWRQVRLGDENVTPANAEGLQYYMHVDPVKSGATWPLAEPGEFEGANTNANPLALFTLGRETENPALFIPSEATRLANFGENRTLISAAVDSYDARTIWERGHDQRGMFDPESGASNQPAFEAAQSFYLADFGRDSAYNRSWGGYLPQPAVLGDCPALDGVAGVASFQLFFTPIKEGLPTRYYITPCPDGTTFEGQGTVAVWVSSTPFGWYIYPASGAPPEFLSRQDYIEGPYVGGGILGHRRAEWLARAIEAFNADWRGNAAQRRSLAPDDDAEFDIEEVGFDFQKFFTSQYFLAPNWAYVQPGVGPEGEDMLEPDYPVFEFSSGEPVIAAGELARYTSKPLNDEDFDDYSLNYVPGFVLGGCHVSAALLQSGVQIEVLNDGGVIETITIKPDEAGTVNQMFWFPNAVTPRPLSFRLKTAVQFASASTLRIECTQQMAYKPQLFDAYFLLRLCTTAAEQDDFDTRGVEYDGSKRVSDAYFVNGCAINPFGISSPYGSIAAINVNPVYDAIRRQTRDLVRVVPRQQFVGYEVSGGKSILYFKRFPLGGDKQDIDSFGEIAPASQPVASGTLREGFVYIVRDAGNDPDAAAASVVYNGVTYAAGKTFKAISGLRKFEASAANAEVWEYEGIHAVAPPNGYTNEWLLHLNFHVANNTLNNESSQWKPEAYADIWPLNDRCHFNSPSLSLDRSLWRQVSLYADDRNYVIEAPTGYRYAGGANDSRYYRSDTFFGSCRIYEPPVEVESAQVLIEAGEQIVKLTLKTRLHHTEVAPAAVPRDVTQWDVDQLRNEVATFGRSDDNGLREYLLDAVLNLHCSKNVTGDTGLGSRIWTEPDDPWGACFPHFFLTKLVPEPYLDGNQRMDKKDSLVSIDAFRQMEIYLRAMCEGFIDGQASVALACGSGNSLMFDYTFENLCYDAFKGAWISPFTKAERPDHPQGFGPLPNTIVSAELFNRFSACINKLTRARLMLPMRLETRSQNFASTQAVTQSWGSDYTGSAFAAIWSGSPSDASMLDNDSGWLETGGGDFGAGSIASILDSCAGSNFLILSTKTVTSFRFALVDDVSLRALPPGIAELVQSGATGFLAAVSRGTSVEMKRQVFSLSEAQDCCFGYQGEGHSPCPYVWDGSTGYRFDQESPTTVTCELLSSGTLDLGAPPAGDFWFGRTPSGATCGNSSSKSVSVHPLTEQPAAFLNVPLTPMTQTD